MWRSKLVALLLSAIRSCGKWCHRAVIARVRPCLQRVRFSSPWAHSLFCMNLMPQGLQTHMRVRRRVCHLRPGRDGKKCVMIYDFVAALTNDLFPPDQRHPQRPPQKKWYLMEYITRRRRRAVSKPHYWRAAFLLIVFIFRSYEAQRCTSNAKLFSWCPATTLFRICEHAHAARFCTHFGARVVRK